MSRLRSPIKWFGGKGILAARLLPLIPPHTTYVEPFGGGANLLLAKKPSPVEVYNDLNSGLVSLFRVLRDEEKFAKFYRKVCLTPYSREEHSFCKESWESCEDEVERAYRFFVAARCSFSGLVKTGWSHVVSASERGMAQVCSSWLATIEHLPALHQRLMRVQIEHSDFRRIFALYDTPETFFYCDPPYVPRTRRSGKYQCEMSYEDHEDLVDILLHLQGMALLSGYQNDLYSQLEERGWERIDFTINCFAVGRTPQTGVQGKGAGREHARVESVWLCPRTKKRLAVTPENLPVWTPLFGENWEEGA